MSEEKSRGGLHIHLGGLIIIIIIILLLFKIDLGFVVKSPKFQNNISYIKEQSKSIWDKYLATPLSKKWNNLFNNLIDKGAESIKKGQDSFFSTPALDKGKIDISN